MMSIDPSMKFTRVKNGYDPAEADAVFDEFQRQISTYKNQIRELSEIIGQYDNKIAA